jgi:hypothetical protein
MTNLRQGGMTMLRRGVKNRCGRLDAEKNHHDVSGAVVVSGW